MGEGSNRRRRREHVDANTLGPGPPRPPLGKAELGHAIADNKHRLPIRTDDHRAVGKRVDVGGPESPVRGSIKATARFEPFEPKALVQVACAERPRRVQRPGDGVAVLTIRIPSAVPAGPVPGGEGGGIVKEEDRRPMVGRVERHATVGEIENAHNPQRTVVVAHDLPGLIDQTATVPGEQAAPPICVQIPPRVDPVTPRHRLPVGFGW